MGRWKGGPSGPVWDPNDSGPNQVAPPAGFDPNTGQPLGGGAQPTNTGIVPPQQGGTARAWNREQFRDEWQGMGQTNRAGMNQFLAQWGIGPADQAGRVVLPNGDVMDLAEGARAAGETGMFRTAWGGVGGAPAASSGAGGGAGAGAGGGGNLTPQQQSERDQLYAELLARSKQSLAVDRNDPTLRAQADPYAAQQERTKRNYLADLAERAGQGANLQGEERLANERQGQATGLFEAELIGKEINARRNEIQAALSQRGDMLTNEQKLALQRELGLLEDATKRYGIESSERSAMASVNAQLERAMREFELGNRRLDFDIADREQYWLNQ